MNHPVFVLNQYLMQNGIFTLQELCPTIINEENLYLVYKLLNSGIGIPLVLPSLEVRYISDNELIQITKNIDLNRDIIREYLLFPKVEANIPDSIEENIVPNVQNSSPEESATDMSNSTTVPEESELVMEPSSDGCISNVALQEYSSALKSNNANATKGLWLAANFIYLFAFFITGSVFAFIYFVIFSNDEIASSRLRLVDIIIGNLFGILNLVIGFFFGNAWKQVSNRVQAEKQKQELLKDGNGS